ncbi:hypothetical protein Agub_g12020, partial [Astrephomene gubernaculifera]
MNAKDFIFHKRKGEALIKPPGSINGNGFVLDTLQDCEVYILDHSSQVQVDDCINCKIFIGPTDGSVFLRDCRDCELCVAARQLRTRDCHGLDMALYCATQPSIETSTRITFSCWRGAYPGLSEHFKRARLDPDRNTWMQVYDFNSKEDLGAVHYQLDESVRPWWIAPPPPASPSLPPPTHQQQQQQPHADGSTSTGSSNTAGVDGGGTSGGGSSGAAGEWAAAPPDCPVAAADGSLFGGGRREPPPPPKSPTGSPLPASLPPSPGRAAAYDEEVELEDEEEEGEEGD